ncbi:MAG: DUF935 domain-containing protein [Pseudoflavonifractor sp.]|nr:DUF935 domain-containing protein [Pseudoflavonifractor sp.]
MARRHNNTIMTPHGPIRLARGQKARVRALLDAITRQTDALTRRDVADWRMAWQMALNVDNPSRLRLYDIYRDCLVDLHLSGCIDQRRGFVLGKAFKLVDSEGEADDKILHFFDQAWFKEFLRLAHDSIFWGHSLIELGEISTDGDGCRSFRDVSLIPRKHVIPEYHVVVRNQNDGHESGIDYTQPPYDKTVIEVGRPDDLGLLLKAAPQTIAKKNAMAFWDNFAEIFGMPIRVAKTATRDPAERRRLKDMLENAASAMAVLTDTETTLEFVESSRGDAFNVYDKRIDRANSELSKLIVGQTMTIEDGSSLSQSQTHLEVFENLCDSDRDMLRDVVNNKLIPLMIELGFPVKGYSFEWDDAVEYTPEQQVAFETMVADRYEVDPKYFAEKYGMPIGARIHATSPMAEIDAPDEPEEEDDKQEQNTRTPHDFFD